jgi:H+/Cl- antiporter ClcA
VIRQSQLKLLLLWVLVGGGLGGVTGATSAAFLLLLEHATHLRVIHPWLVYLLPVAGLSLGAIYQRLGHSIQGGSNLIIDALHAGGPKIPVRMAPMVLLGTLATHLFGGSAGREGAAVQMGASLADGLASLFRQGPTMRPYFLAAGVAGGFGSVFGTPIAGTLFALEFVVLGRLSYAALWPALVASLVGDQVTRCLGVRHTVFPTVAHLDLSILTFAKWLVFAFAAAATATVFIELTHFLKKAGESHLRSLPLRMALGGACVAVAWQLCGTAAYLGLGVPEISRAFVDPTLPPYAFVLKLVFTVLTLSAGFLGGEVTPLFFIGAALGNCLAHTLNVPLSLGAGLTMVAVFGCAANTPLSMAIMAVELMGLSMLPHAMVVCVTAYFLIGHRSLYPAQRMQHDKQGNPLDRPLAIGDWRHRR